jgi:hypothetical protein
MRRNIFIVLCAVLVLCFSGCVVVNLTDEKGVSGKGVPEKYEINAGGYSGIKVEGRCEIRYFAALSNTVTLEIQPNLREYYTVEVQNGELVVRTTRRINYGSSVPVLTVSTPALNRLTIAGICSFKANDKINSDAFNLEISGAGDGTIELDVNSLKANMSGASNFEFSGKADIAEFNMSGAGKLNALSLQAREASVDLSGAGTIRINSSEKLSIKASGAGTVEYKGSPSLSLNTSGAVSIKQVN